MTWNPNKVVQWYRDNQANTSGVSDYDLYERAMDDFPQIRKELEEVGNPFNPAPPEPIVTNKVEEEVEYSPQKLEGLTSWMNLADHYADEGIPSLGIKPEFFKKAYNESLAGMTYAAANGKFKYDVGDYDPSFMEEMGAFLAATLNPIDASLFFLAPIGGAMKGTKLAQGQLAKWGTKAIADGTRKKIAQTPLASSVYQGTMELGLGFGTYATAAGAISSASQQATNTGKYEGGDGKIDAWSLTKDATAAGLEGIAMGAVAGGASRGIGHRYAKWELANKGATNLQKKTKKTLNVLGQMGVEAGSFTAIPYLIHGVPKDETGDIAWKEVGKQLVAEFALDGVIRTGTGDIFRQANQDLKQFSNSLGNSIKSKLGENDQLSKSIKNVVGDSPESANIFRETQADELNKLVGNKDAVDKLIADTDRALELSNRPEESLTMDERIELATYANTLSELKGLYQEVLDNPETLDKPLTPEQEVIYKKQIEAIDSAKDKINNLDELKADADAKKDADVDTDVPKRKDLSEMTDTEIIDEATRITGRTQADLRKEYTEDKLDIMKGEKIPTLNRERLMSLLVEPKDFPSIKTPDELVDFYKDSNEQLRDKSIEIANTLDSEKISYSPRDNSKINESHYDIQEIAVNSLVNREVKKGARSKSGALVDIATDKQYISAYKRFADLLSKKGKSLRDATFDEVRAFILTDKPGAENALAILYKRLNDKGLLKDPLLRAEVSEISSIVKNIPEKPMKGLRLGDIDIENGIIEFIQSKSLFPKGVPISERLRTLFSRIMGKENKVAGDTVFRTIDGAALNETQLKTFVKDFFGDKAKISDFRKGLSQYVATEYGVNSKEWATIEAIGLGHKQALGQAEQRAYIKDIKLDEQFKKLRDEFVGLITSDVALKPEFKGTYKEGGLTIEQLRDGYSRIVKQEPGLRIGVKGKALGKWVDDNYKLGQKSISKDTAEAIARYMFETSPRPQDIVPKKQEIFKKVVKRIKPTDADTSPKKGIKEKLGLEEEKPLKINEIDTPEKSVKYWEQQQARVKERLKAAKTDSQRETLQGQMREAGMKLSASKKLIEYNEKIAKAEEGKTKQNLMIERDKVIKSLGLQNVLKDVKKRTDAQRIEGEVEFQGKDIQAERNKFIDKVLKKNNLTREQLKEAGLDANTLGEWGDGMIKLQRGEWQPADFYHENLHRLKSFAEKTNNKSLMKLIEKAEGLGRTAKEFKAWKKNNPTRDMEEFLADVVGGKASKIEFSKGMLPKLNQLIKQIVSRVKTAFGVGNFNDYARVLAKKVQKGFDTKGVKFDKTVKKREIGVEAKELRKKLRTDFDLLIEKVFKTTDDKDTRKLSSDLLKGLATQAGIENPNKITRASLSKLSVDDLQSLIDTISQSDIQKLRARKNLMKWLEAYRNVNEFRLASNVSKANQEFFLKQLGVKDGDITKANVKTLKIYKNMLKELGFKPSEHHTWVDEAFNQGLIDESQVDLIEKFNSFGFEATRAVGAVETALRSLGNQGARIANRLFDHQSQEARYIGDLVEAEGRAMNHLGGEKQFNKVKDFFYLMDKGRRLERQEKGYLTAKENAFIRKAFNEDGSFNMDSGEGKALNEMSEFNITYKNNLLDAVKQIMNDAQYEDWLNNSNIDWLDSREYVHRGFTKEFNNAFSINSKATRDLIRSEADKIAIKMIEKKYPGLEGDAKNRKIAEIDAEALDIARQNISSRGSYIQTSISSRFLQSRMKKKLDEKIWSEKLKKWVDTYETSYDGTFRKYSLGMAKFMSNIEFFPEYVRFKGYKPTPDFKTKLQQLSEAEGGAKAKEYLTKIVEKQLGIHETDAGFVKSARVLNDYASIIAKTQLSFPTSGLKNALVGNYQTLGAFRVRDFFRGVIDSFDSDLRREMRKTGQTELGLRNIDNQISIFGAGKKVNKTLDFIFKGGAMRPTENMNRYIAVRAAKAEQTRLVQHLLLKDSTRKYKNAVTRLKEFYRLTDDEVGMLKEYGMGGADGLKPGVSSAKISRRMNQLYQKMDTAAHIYTQGSTLDLFMPEAFGAKYVKPLTLYKRMAYAALSNTLRNGRIAWKTKSLMRPAMMTLGAYASGQALMGLYDTILGQSPPQENGDWWDSFFTTMWKGEMFGIMSEFMNPTNSEGFMTSPAIYNHAALTYSSLTGYMKGELDEGQALGDWFKSTFGAGNQLIKMWDNKEKMLGGEKSYNGKYKKYRRLHAEFSEKLQKNKADINFERDARTPYFREFTRAFNLGTEKEFARAYALTFFSVATHYYHEGYNAFGKRIRNQKEAFKEAQKTMDKKMKLLNPNKAKWQSKSKIARTRAERFLMDFLDEKQRKELGALENEYRFKIRSFDKNKNKYFKELNIPELMGRFDWD